MSHAHSVELIFQSFHRYYYYYYYSTISIYICLHEKGKKESGSINTTAANNSEYKKPFSLHQHAHKNPYNSNNNNIIKKKETLKAKRSGNKINNKSHLMLFWYECWFTQIYTVYFSSIQIQNARIYKSLI